ncbi:T9SS type A sorting domain-containing protein [uncultured Bacteroides sp.]|uniref:T9SS type A sorting domain-containing protein n=1 Tax=uncultured Bacteroides sp. TaxID=162156 RepID=UPI002AABADD3|nr:T9SS type A sorting domain-containing protein [uncultured Bacteroides sp.]
MKNYLILKITLVFIFVSLTNNAFSQLILNDKCQAILSNPTTGLVPTTLDDFSYTNAERNAKAITTALSRLSKGQDLKLPEGVYDVTTIQVPTTLNGCIIAGIGMNKTILRRKAFSWDNNTQGDCPMRTEVFRVQDIQDFELCDMTIDGNCHQMAISGYGQFSTTTGKILTGTPQFPAYTNGESSGPVVNITLSKSIKFSNVDFKNGYGWCILLGKIDGFQMQNCIIDTGNLSTEFKGHRNLAPNDVVIHAHTSQDGLHMVNVSNAVIEFNDIHSEDSAIAIELNPLWNWGGYDISENIAVRNNYVSTASPTDPAKLLNDDDIIYGTGLANTWVGQSAVDIFYNDAFDTQGKVSMGGENSTFRNIEISQNAFEGVRQGVRCGFFLGGGQNNAESIYHRIYNLMIKDNNPNFLAGRNKDKPAGILNVTKNEISTSWNLNGGAGIAVRHVDSLIVSNNEIRNCKGGLGISIQDVTRFNIVDNRIDNIIGTQLGSNWTGGEGIRVYNNLDYRSDPLKGQSDAVNFLIKDNKIGTVATTKIAIINTKNGVARLDENFDLSSVSLCEIANGINTQNVSNIDLGGSLSSGIKEQLVLSDYKTYPNPVKDNLYIWSYNNIPTSYVLFDSLGRPLYKCRSNANQIVIPMDNFPPNLYFVRAFNNTNITTVLKIIKE